MPPWEEESGLLTELTEADVLKRVGLVRLHAQLQAGLRVAERVLCGRRETRRGKRRRVSQSPRGKLKSIPLVVKQD